MEQAQIRALQSRLRTERVGRQFEWHETIDSTNTRAIALAKQGAPDGTVIVAERQTAGRGRLGRRWYAPAGSSLLLSILFRPPLAPRQAQRLTMICSLGAIAAIRALTGVPAAIKWPNDLVVRGRKLGGVLTELGAQAHTLEYAIVGMGINVNMDPADIPEAMVPPTSLSAEVGAPVSRLDLLQALLQEIDDRYRALLQGVSPHIEWRRHLVTLGQSVQVGLPERVVSGIAEDVDVDGALWVRLPDGSLERILVGDVTLRGHALSD